MKPRNEFEQQIVALGLEKELETKLILSHRAECSKKGEEWPLDIEEHTELLEQGRLVMPVEMFRKAIEVAAKAWWHEGTRRTSRPISIGEIDAEGVEIRLDKNRLIYLEQRAKLLYGTKEPEVKAPKKRDKPTSEAELLKTIQEAAKKAAEKPKVEHRNLDDLPDWDDLPDEDEDLLSDEDIMDLIKKHR